MKIKPQPANGTKVWISTVKHAGGPVLVAHTADGTLVASTFLGTRKPTAVAAVWQRQWPQLSWQSDKAKKAPNLKAFAPVGTDFQRAVWEKTAAIKPGNILTYGDIARMLGNPKASRAVGTALGKNNVVPFIPCHRVIGSNGSLGGYSGSGGLDQKRQLLAKEKVKLK